VADLDVTYKPEVVIEKINKQLQTETILAQFRQLSTVSDNWYYLKQTPFCGNIIQVRCACARAQFHIILYVKFAPDSVHQKLLKLVHFFAELFKI